MTMSESDSLELMLVAQAGITESLAVHADVLKDISKTLTTIAIDQGRMEERIVSILENNQRVEATVSSLSGRMRNVENLSSVSKFTQSIAPRLFFSLISAFTVGGALVYVALQIVSKGGV